MANKSKIKQVIIIRKDLKMRRGKEIAQGAHAAMAFLIKYGYVGQAELDHNPAFHNESLKNLPEIEQWMHEGFTKICLVIDSEKELIELHEAAIKAELNTNLITDSGFTEFNGVPTKTALAIGPNKAEEIDKITGHLKLY